MVRMKCEMCGAVWTKDDSYRGTEIRCANCQGKCKCMQEDEPEVVAWECADCGLSCPPGADKCPACGGKVVPAESEDAPADSVTKDNATGSSFWEGFFWGLIFPEQTFLVGIISLFVRSVKIKSRISFGFVCGAILRYTIFVILIYAFRDHLREYLQSLPMNS